MNYSRDNFPFNFLFTCSILSSLAEKKRHSFEKPFEAFLNVRIVLSFLKLKFLVVLIHCSSRYTCDTVVVYFVATDQDHCCE